MRAAWARFVSGALSTFGVVAVFAAPPSVVTKPLACISKDRNARITARIEGRVKNARVLFHSFEPKCDEYFVDMRQSANDPNLYWAVLPLTGSETQAVAYQVRVDPGNGEKPVLSPSLPLIVSVQNACSADPLSPSEQAAAENITLGLTANGQSGAPCAFKCNGIKSILTASNELKPNEECFRVLAAAARKPWYNTTAGRVGIGAAALGGAYLWNQNRNDDKPVSPARP
jgi:hypothetical protein